jgi:hypothetical protein
MRKFVLIFISILVLNSCKKGEQGLNSLINISFENPGVNCSNGGKRIDSGIDKNENEILDSSEIQSTSFICNESITQTKIYVVENNQQLTKIDSTWTDFMKTTITVDSDSSSILLSFDISAIGVIGAPEIAFRGKLDDTYSNPSIVIWKINNGLENPHFDFAFTNVKKGSYEVGIQWNALSGGITTSKYQTSNYQQYAFNRLIITVIS